MNQLAELLRVFLKIRRQFKWIVLVSIAFGVIVGIYAFYSVSPSYVSEAIALVRPQRTPEEILTALRDHGFRILDVPAEDRFSPANGVALGPRHLVMPAGNPRTQRLLEEAGCAIDTVDIQEIIKSGGAVHCLTGFLRREDP